VADATDETPPMPTFAGLLHVALESTRQTVTNLNEALQTKNASPKRPITPAAAPERACPAEGKSASPRPAE
jgi:hypothetical protein